VRNPVPRYGHTLRDQWQFEPGITYLNHGAFGAPSIPVEEAARRWRDRTAANPTSFFERQLPSALRDNAQELANHLGGAGDDLVFVNNVTAGINAVLRSLVLMPGDEVVVTNHLYISARRTLDFVCERAGARLIFADVPFPVRNENDIVSAIVGAMSPRTRLVMLDHVTHETALVLPIERIAARCAERGVAVLIDGTHGPGNIPIALDRLGNQGVGWYAGSCHNWLGAPQGCGFLWVHPDRQGLIRPTAISNRFGDGFTEAFDWPGTSDFSAWLAVTEALRHRGTLGGDRVPTYTHDLAQRAAGLLRDRWNTLTGAPLEMFSGMATVALPVDGPATPSAAADLRHTLRGDYRIEVHIMPFNGRLWVRLSAYLYNEISDYERLADAVLEITGGNPVAANG
jgi:isopenicillin-N epimerase